MDILILIALISTVFVGFFGVAQTYGVFAEFIFPMIIAVAAIGLCVYAVLLHSYIAADTKKDLINSMYDTSYTQDDVFYGEDLIQSLHNIETTGKKL
jgi:hypothetical protein